MVRQRWPKSKSNLGFQFQSSIFEAKTLSTVTGCQVTTQIFTLGVILILLSKIFLVRKFNINNHRDFGMNS